MNKGLEFDAEWELSGSDDPAERACFAEFGIRYGDRWLTEADDRFVRRIRSTVHLSVYPLAEWLAWNWWRLRWEPWKDTPGWALSHRLASIGKGYVWPNITIRSDGERVAIQARPTQGTAAEPLHYIAHVTAVVRAVEYEGAIDRFIDQVIEQLKAEGVRDTPLQSIWPATLEERAAPNAARWRRIEAMAGFDPDEAETGKMETLVAATGALGENALAEIIGAEIAGITLDSMNGSPARILRDHAHDLGTANDPSGMVRLSGRLAAHGFVSAAQRGVEAARLLRTQAGLGDGPLSNGRLCAMAAVTVDILAANGPIAPLSFSLDETPHDGRILLRSRWQAGRRFDLARLLGDRLLTGTRDRLHPSTGAATYRQKAQRAFAAELLCPFETLDERMNGDYSSERIEEAAQDFNVSPLMVRNLLALHGRLRSGDRMDDDERLDAA